MSSLDSTAAIAISVSTRNYNCPIIFNAFIVKGDWQLVLSSFFYETILKLKIIPFASVNISKVYFCEISQEISQQRFCKHLQSTCCGGIRWGVISTLIITWLLSPSRKSKDVTDVSIYPLKSDQDEKEASYAHSSKFALSSTDTS